MKNFFVPETLQIGEYYTNDQIQYALEVGNSGGIRPKIKEGRLDFIVLITSAGQSKDIMRNPYADRIEGEILTYTGAGLAGEQTMTGVNKRIVEQKENPIPILGFIKEGTNKYRFIGFLLLLRNYQDYQIDSNGKLRKVLLFEFQIFSEIPTVKIGKFNDPFLPIYNHFKKEILLEDTIIDSFAGIQREEQGLSAEKTEEELKNVEILKNKLLTIDPYQFEVLMSELIKHTGFSNVEVTRKSGDDGVDINALLKHSFSFDLNFKFQVKRWKHSVGRNEVANLRGSLGFNNFGVIVSTSHFTSSAINEAEGTGKTPIGLIGIKSLYEIISETKFSIKI